MDKLLALAVLSLLTTFSALVHGATISPCSQTPYPELCNSFTNTQPLETLEKMPLAFRYSALRVTMASAQVAHHLISAMDTSSFNALAKSAWADCLYLYEDTIDQLKDTLDSGNATSLADVQTWLSAANTNLETCKNGFIDFDLSSNLQSFPNVIANVSKFLSNSLAINKAIASSPAAVSSKENRGRRLLSHGFPGWVSTADRKLLQSSGPGVKPDIVVAQDGSGNYKTISEAVAASVKQSGGTSRFVIYVKKGVYKEYVGIKKTMKNLMFIGDGIDATIVTGNGNVQEGSTTFRSATFGVSGDGFIARDMTFENTAGPQKQQAVAFRSGSDHSVLYRCSFKGYQDTLYVYSKRQFYRECDIYGTQDFIFGDAAVVLQNCNIYVRNPLSNQKSTVTAQGRTDPNENTGIIIHNSIVAAASGLGSTKTYLGRPWKEYSRTVFMKSSLGGLINSAGWLPWSGDFALKTLYYGEYMNTGPGAGTGGRVKWPGYHVITSATEAGKFSVRNFLAGNSWISSTGVPFTSDL